MSYELWVMNYELCTILVQRYGGVGPAQGGRPQAKARRYPEATARLVKTFHLLATVCLSKQPLTHYY
jgi:hypothetical protein